MEKKDKTTKLKKFEVTQTIRNIFIVKGKDKKDALQNFQTGFHTSPVSTIGPSESELEIYELDQDNIDITMYD
jgi:hypothetical protein